MLFLEHDARLAALAEIGEGLFGAFEIAGGGAGFDRRHGGRQVDQPLRGDGETAHHLERRGGVLLGHHDPAHQLGIDETPAADIGIVEHPVGFGLAGEGVGGGEERPRRLGIDARGGHGDQLALGPAERRELAAEHAAGVDVDGVVDPLGLGHRGVAIDHRGLAAILGGPVEADGEAESVDFAAGFAIKRELAHGARTAADQLLLETGMGDGEAAAGEPVMAAQLIEEASRLIAEFWRFAAELLDRLFQPVRHLDVAASEPAAELLVVVALDAIADPVAQRRHDETQHARRIGAAIDEVADEDQLAALRRDDLRRLGRAVDAVAEPLKQQAQLVGAAMHIADNVERALVLPLVGPERAAIDAGGVDLGDRPQPPDLAKPLALQAGEAAADFLHHALRHGRAEIAVGPGAVALDADIGAGVDDDGDGQGVVAPRQFDPAPAIGGADIGGVDNGEPAVLQPFAGNGLDQVEGVGGCRLVGLVVGDEGAAVIGRDDLGGQEPARGEGGFARTGGADQHDEAEIGDIEHAHLRNTASWVRAPCSAWGSPTPSISRL